MSKKSVTQMPSLTKKGVKPLFDTHWDEEWEGMPEYDQQDLMPWKQLTVSFATPADVQEFAEMVGQTIRPRTRFINFPMQDRDGYANKRYKVTESNEKNQPRHPIYIISKGRWENPLTARALEAIDVPFRIVVEPDEYENYAGEIDPGNILVAPENFSKLGKGSIPVRNFVWNHSRDRGYKWHWIMDDNIRNFVRLNYNLHAKVDDGAIFRAAEDFVERYDNVGQAGFNYFMFANRKQALPPYYLNTRVYSCILNRNDLPEEDENGEPLAQWRGRYNEDTDLSLRILKNGWCTVLFNAFLAYKMPTLTMKGGNTDELYEGDGRLRMAESLRDQHPDVTKVTFKWGRWQHQVDYSGFKMRGLKRRDDIYIPTEPDEYGMVFEEFAPVWTANGQISTKTPREWVPVPIKKRQEGRQAKDDRSVGQNRFTSDRSGSTKLSDLRKKKKSTGE